MKKRTRLTLSISGIVVLLAASAWSMHLHYLYDGTEAWDDLLMVLDSVILVGFAFGLLYFFLISMRFYNRYATIRMFQQKMTKISEMNEIHYVIYETKTKVFYRWNAVQLTKQKVFTLGEFWEQIHPSDMKAGRLMTDYLQGMGERLYETEFRFRLDGEKDYSWYYCEMFPYRYDDDGQVAEYIGVCKVNNQIHEKDDSLTMFRRKVSFITQANGISFVSYDVREDRLFYMQPDSDTMVSEIPMDQYWASIYPEDIPVAEHLMKKLQEHKVPQYHTEYRYRLPDDDQAQWYTVDVGACEYDEDGVITKYMCLCRLNDEWHRQMDRALELQERAEEASQMKTAFIRNMSHEIRTPLNAISGFTQLLDTENIDDEERRQFVEVIKHNTDMLTRIIDDVLMLSVIECGRVTFERTDFDLSAYLHDICDSVRPQLHEGLKLECREHPLLMVKMDSRRLNTVVTTLLLNADKFTPGAGTVTLDYHPLANGVELMVEDTGIGIAEEDQQRIFERFEKVNPFTQGSGIGLTICKTIVEKAGGTITVDSKPGKGSRFIVRLEKKQPIR